MFVDALSDRGVLMSQLGATTVRAITHLDVGADDVTFAIVAARDAATA
ncbi:MAG TPA: hypothetical protein VFI46_01085 [Jiangellaceae bacterium]|nr:hypothetical protein [Jiangellaceae bacterium]